MMANELPASARARAAAARLAPRVAGSRSFAVALGAAAAIALAAVARLSSTLKTQGADAKRQNEVLGCCAS